MVDREKVIEALHCRAYDDDFPCTICAYYRPDEKPVAKCDYRGLMDDAIALLNEQEAVVHCKDCIWYDKEDPGYTTGICKMNDRMFPKEHFFCAHGFKRSKDDE